MVHAVMWMFVAVVTFSDGSMAEWPASFDTQEACEEFRGNLHNWFDENAEGLNIVYAKWDESCREVMDPYPLDPQSDQHSH
jgi:hypothetical protein